MTNTDYLLQLSTEEPVRRKIKIDDQEYELGVPEDFELGEFLQLSAAGSKASALIKERDGDFESEDIPQLTDLINQIVRAAIRELPDDVFNRLKLIQKFAIVNVFSDAVGSKTGGALLQAGQKPSPDLPDSTDQKPETG